MEINTVLADKPKQIKDHKVIMDNRKRVTITAVSKALSANEGAVILQLANNKIFVSGKDLHISKLDVVDGMAEIEGEIYSVKYSNVATPQGFFKRLFK